MAIGSGQPGFPFTPAGVLNAPHVSGVYCLYNQRQWIYVGESNDIQRRLSEHLAQQGTCIKQWSATGFQFELVARYERRVARRNQWIAALHPTCNQKMG